ncbi:MAG: acyl-CoA dehydrogenase family protein [Burkholderiaceae bacterium]
MKAQSQTEASHTKASKTKTSQPATSSLQPPYRNIAPDCHGLNFFEIDHSLRSLMPLYIDKPLLDHLGPHYQELGGIAGNKLDALARIADRNKPILRARDALGRDEDWIEFHPAYREMEAIGYGQFGLAAMSHRGGVLGWPEPIEAPAKYMFQYLFAQAEFGLLCPISVTDTSAMLLERYGDDSTKALLLDNMHSLDAATSFKGGQFMTEKSGGSDVSVLELTARQDGGQWRLHGDKWFCSCADADVCLLLARPENAPAGNSGLALFAMPRHLPDGTRNHYRIARLKDKMGTSSMASGEIVFDGAIAYPMGEVQAGANSGLRMMMDQVNLSRLSHGARAAGMMRRCLNEAMIVARHRDAFGEKVINKPLMRRQLMKLMVPTEQSLSMILFTATQLHRAQCGDETAKKLLRILTPIVKTRACRDNIRVATGSMEVRGGNGYIEDWVHSRLIRDAHVGVLWEGTSNINALDVTRRAAGQAGAHHDLGVALIQLLDQAPGLAPGLYKALMSATARTIEFVDTVARAGDETQARLATSALYNCCSAVLMASEGAALAATGGDARRLLLAKMVLDHRLTSKDPLSNDMTDSDGDAIAHLLSDDAVSLADANALMPA